MSAQFETIDTPSLCAIRASFLDFKQVVGQASDIVSQFRFIQDGLLVIQQGRILWFGEWQQGQHLYPDLAVTHYPDQWIVPGFIDTHIHYPQTEMIAAYGEQLLSWLEKYTFPVEMQFADKQYASEISRFFIQQLFSNGTTTALVFGSAHPQSVDALFEVAEEVNMRLIAGKVMMDRHAPAELCDTVESSYTDSKRLIEKWHGKGRLLYAITPRFAPTSTPEQLQAAQRLREEFPDVYVQTHLSENQAEIEWVKQLFPERKNYLDVYHHYGLTGERSVFAHGIHLCEDEWQCLSETQSSIAFCPTSNLFIGSGLFKLTEAWKHQVSVGMGTDVGGGTSFNILQTLNEAYKVMQLQGYSLSACEALYLATLGAAHALKLDDKLGNFAIGKEADFVVLDLEATPLQRLRQQHSGTVDEKLFALIMLGDDRNIYCTYVNGVLVHQRDTR
ncbi:guanine deaminase [Alkanindiges illinoisensis]|uniref:guanine deaminase n=1 Tax=Alkanindiges illinoisensis TaxID=197183 RepID=UPI000687ED64|nr:guanine deaminase [Alkanindiges illinoisensis]